MGKASREKGKRGERELAHWLAAHGYDAKRGQQYSGATGDADVVGLPGIHIECKRVEELDIKKAMQQSELDAYADSLKHGRLMLPVVFHKQNRRPWQVTMKAADFARMCGGTAAGGLVHMTADDFMTIYKGGNTW